jgi:hypothetical protein
MGYFDLMAAILLAGIGPAGEDSVVTGQYLEDRSNRVYGCPCEWSSESASNGREAVLAWKIESGTYGGEALAGLRLAAVLAGSYTLSDATTLRRSTLYADAGAPEPQRRAGVAWLRSRFGDMLGSVQAVHTVPIEFQFAPGSVAVRVGSVLEVELRQADFGLDTMPWATLLYDPFLKLTSSTLGTALHTRYAGPELAIGWRRDDTITAITGYFGTFAVK